MTDRIKGLTVVLRADMRDDDAEPLITAIQLLNGVVEVTPHVAEADHHFAVSQAKDELRRKMRGVLWDL